jgi:hypothetical protein
MATDELIIRCGEIVAQRLFDVADSIDLARAEKLWVDHLGSVGGRAALPSAPTKAVAFGVPPLCLTLPAAAIDVEGTGMPISLSGRLYDFGVVVLTARLPVIDTAWEKFSRWFNAFDRAVGAESATELWKTSLTQLREVLAPSFEHASDATLEEDYLLGVVQVLDPPLDASQLRERADLVALLSGETRALSDAAQRELLQRAYSYFADDLVVLTWDRAFIYEPRGDTGVADVIEVANAQLVEFRYYDELLDAELPHMNRRVQEARRAGWVLAARRFADLARRLYTLVADVSVLTEKVDNALQVTEDVYLARVYAAALELFRVPKLSAAVDRKLSIIRDTYAALHEEASSQRAELLEFAIVGLIVLEIVLALVRH